MFNWITPQWAVTTAIATYAAILLTFQAIAKWHEKRRKVDVSLSVFRMFSLSGKSVGGGSLKVDLRNRGAKCRLDSCYVTVDGVDKRYRFPYAGDTPSFPLVMEVFDEHHLYEPEIGDLAIVLQKGGLSGVVKLRAWADELGGKRFRSKSLEFDIGETLAERGRRRTAMEESAKKLPADLPRELPKMPDISSIIRRNRED